MKGEILSVEQRLSRRFRTIARIAALFLAAALLLFSFFSGMEKLGGLEENLSDTFPWIALLFFVFIAWKWELWGGFLLIAFGAISIFFFDVFSRDSWPALFTVSLPILILGGLFIAAHGLEEKD